MTNLIIVPRLQQLFMPFQVALQEACHPSIEWSELWRQLMTKLALKMGSVGAEVAGTAK